MKACKSRYPFSWGRFACYFSLCLTVICLLCCKPFPLFAQDIDNLHIEKVQDEGLTNNNINCINQDANGFMWFGTFEGLFRYDGYNFEAFRNFPGDSTTLFNNDITCMYADGEKIWIGSAGGLSCIDINSRVIKNITAPGSAQISSITPDGDSGLWIGTVAGLFQFNKSTLKWKELTVIGKKVFVSSVIDDKKGHLYITSRGGFYCYTKSNGACKHYNPNLEIYPKEDKVSQLSYNHAMLDSNGNLWMGVWDAGLVRFDTKTEKITVWSHPTDNVHLLPYKIILDQLEDDNGNIWLANKEAGLTIFNPVKNKFTNYPVDYESETQISGGVRSLYRDKCGIFWIGTENGIFKYDPHRIHLSKTNIKLKTDTGMVASTSSPISILRDKDGLWWMGMYDGLFIYDKKNNVLADYTQKAGSTNALAVFNIVQDNSGAIWFTARNLLFKVVIKPHDNTSAIKTEMYSSPDIQSTIYNLYIDHEGRMWVGTSGNGIYRFDPSTKKFTSYHYNVMNSRNRVREIEAFCELSKDSLLTGGDGTGLLLLHVKADRFEKIKWNSDIGKLSGDLSINAIFRKNDKIWIGTQYNGLWRTDVHLSDPLTLTVNNGLPSMGIESIMADDKNNIWAVSDAGVVEYDPQSKKISIFDKRDGIQNVNGLKLMIDKNSSDILITTKGCYYNFNPENITKNTRPPKVFITGLKVFDKDYNVNVPNPIELSYHQNYFSLAYVALNYTQSKLNRYAYKLEGLDTKWNYVGTRRYVSYANLQEGTYTFEVKASNNEGVWSTAPAKLTIIITPPFYHRWWFYLAVFVVAVIIIYSLYVYNINQLKLRLEIRDKIARDLHDDIGSTLSGINIFSKIALQKMGSDIQGSSELMEKISDRSEKTLDALSDIVWSINTRNDGMDHFLLKAKEYLAEVLEPQSIAYEFTIDPEMEHLKIGMGIRKELYLIFKESVYNAYKYSGCTIINITLTHHRDICTLTITDNGKGFDTSVISTGNGIYNMKQRAAKMKAELETKSEKNKGTVVTMHFRIPRFR